MNENNAPGTQDHESDPARTPDDGWGEEGGASHLGPATHIQSGQPKDEHDADEAESDEEE
ncbi:hypothetical protein [Leucobacter sp. W1153]|uniref:hypothetical protein n=1 Tax=unclassified Leucobacter TaxID=2621730 RepID=UPI003F2ABCF4